MREIGQERGESGLEGKREREGREGKRSYRGKEETKMKFETLLQ